MKVQLTEEGLNKLKLELKELVDNKRVPAVERLQKARAMGDLSENSEYTAAKEDLAFIEGRIKELEEVLRNAEIVQSTIQDGSIDIGSKVIVESDNGTEEFVIVGEFEADPLAKKLSSTSPIGKALLGKKIHDAVEVIIPAGKRMYKIIDIRKC